MHNPCGAEALLTEPDGDLPICASSIAPPGALLSQGALNDPEGSYLPTSLPPVIDAHVHLFPDRMFEAIWRWFDTHGWPIRYKLKTPAVIEHLLARGVEQIVALHYSHKPGIARSLNRYMAEISASHPRVMGLATVFPGEPESREILEEAFETGLGGVKLHCHVQAFAPDSAALEPVYQACIAAGRPLIMHAGREPSSPAYPIDPYTLCAVDRVEAVLRSYPELRLCVPHLGADEFSGYARLLERYDSLWLDTTMSGADYFDIPFPMEAIERRPERVMYGTDFPNIPYAWDREVKALSRRCKEEVLEAILGGNARTFYGLEGASG